MLFSLSILTILASTKERTKELRGWTSVSLIYKISVPASKIHALRNTDMLRQSLRDVISLCTRPSLKHDALLTKEGTKLIFAYLCDGII